MRNNNDNNLHEQPPKDERTTGAARIKDGYSERYARVREKRRSSMLMLMIVVTHPEALMSHRRSPTLCYECW